MHELTVSLDYLDQDQLEKLQDVYYSLGCRWYYLSEGEKYLDLLGYGAETLTNRSPKSTMCWSRGVNFTPTHTYEEALALVAPNSDVLRQQLDDNEKMISKLQEDNLRIVQVLRKRKLKPI